MQYKKITNPHEGAPPDNSTIITARLSTRVYNYLFKQVLIGRGVKQGIICTMFEALYQECVAQKIPPTWDETNETKVANIIEKTNFHADSVRNLLIQFPRGFTVQPDGTVAGLPDGPEHANRPAPERKAQPKVKGRNPGPVENANQQDPATQHQQSDTNSPTAD